ncbi:MAG: methyltransferase domain-containing protein [Planctomycetes bacterium]|nr:methyltransferase domain-containing protein [Planctomycetota bacterium]
MTLADVLLLLGYLSLLVEITCFPIPSEASTWQLFAPDADTRATGERLLAVRMAPLWRRGLLWLLPTVFGVVAFLAPALVAVGVPHAWSGVVIAPSVGVTWAGVVLFLLGRLVTATSVLQLRQRRAAVPAADGLFRWSRNPGLCGMALCWLGLALVLPSALVWVGMVVWAVNMHRRVLLEEDHLDARLGEPYRRYRRSVPRYLLTHDRDDAVDEPTVAAWFDATYRRRGLHYVRPYDAYPIYLQLLGARPGMTLLDVACGPGHLLRAGAERGAIAIGIDLSRAALQLAAENAPAARLVAGSALELPFADATFDAVTCIGSLERFLDRPRALAEMRRVAHPEARFVFLVRNADTLVWRLWRELLGRREVAGHQDAATLSQWQQRFLAAGFAIDTVVPDQWPRQRLRRWWRRRRPGQDEPVAGSLLPLRWCNEFLFVLRNAR